MKILYKVNNGIAEKQTTRSKKDMDEYIKQQIQKYNEEKKKVKK